MRRLIAIALTILYQIGISAGFVSDSVPTENMGIPSEDAYTQAQITSRVPWDMVISDDKLYLGGGDYGANTGPVDIWCMDLSTKEWSVSGSLNDEAIGKFITVGERVYAPGFDAKNSTWEYGNYHWLEKGVWNTNPLLPDAVHNFDIIQYEDQLFFAIGTGNAATSPVKKSSDDGATFSDVSFIKNGTSLFDNSQFDFTRVYDFFLTDQGLYCMLLAVTDGVAPSYDFYHYSDDAFHFISTHSQIKLNIKSMKQEPISSKVTYKGSCYIAAWYLSRTSDFQTVEQIVLPRNEVAIDLLVDHDRLYVLSAELKDEYCTVRIYAYIYNSFFYPVASFDASNLPASFVKYNNTFYIGLNKRGYDKDIAGSIHQVTVPELTIQLLEDCS